MIEQVSNNWFKGFHIYIRELGVSKSGKTLIWGVVTENNEILGQVKWFGRWRKYAFFPKSNTLYEQDCLRDIADFCEDRTKLHRLKKKKVGK